MCGPQNRTAKSGCATSLSQTIVIATTNDMWRMAYTRRILSHAEFDKSTIFVPGHGQLGGQEVVKLQGEVFDDIAGQTEK